MAMGRPYTSTIKATASACRQASYLVWTGPRNWYKVFYVGLCLLRLALWMSALIVIKARQLPNISLFGMHSINRLYFTCSASNGSFEFIVDIRWIFTGDFHTDMCQFSKHLVKLILTITQFIRFRSKALRCLPKCKAIIDVDWHGDRRCIHIFTGYVCLHEIQRYIIVTGQRYPARGAAWEEG